MAVSKKKKLIPVLKVKKAAPKKSDNVVPDNELDKKEPNIDTPSANKSNADETPKGKTETNNGSKININMNGIGSLIGNASQIVLKAASILELEVAKGILAAQQVEEKYSDVPKMRSGDITSNRQFDDLFMRFKKDGHDILDLIVDFTAIVAKNASKVTSQFIKIGAGKIAPASNIAPPQIPLIQMPDTLKAGEKRDFPVTLENDNNGEAKSILFINTPLTDPSGNQLPPATITFLPNPLMIPAASRGNVTITVNIPAAAKPGIYNCFIQAQNSESLKAILMVTVT